MKFAKTQMIASVVGIVTSANANGIRNASVPNVKTRMSSAIGSAMSSPRTRSSPNTGSRSCSIAACPVRYTVAPEIEPIAARMSSVRLFESAGSRSETIWATVTSCVTGSTLTRRLVGSFATARSAAARTSGTSARAMSSLRTTIVNEPVERCPKWSWRITSARRVSVPGRVKRFVSRPESWDDAHPATTNTTSQETSTAYRCRRTNRVKPSTGSTLARG